MANSFGMDAGAFREGIRGAMRMGLPVEEERWPRFRIPVRVAPVGAVDGNGVPFDLSSPVAAADYRYERPLCALETSSSSDSPWLERGQVLVTLLDEEYALVQGFDRVELWLGGVGAESAVYKFSRVVQQPTLETVGVWQLLCVAEDVA